VHLKQTLPMLPDELLTMLTADHGLTLKDAKTLISLDDGARTDYYLDVVDQARIRLERKTPEGLGPAVGNW
jgi:aspartyl-tRNA(Asn)/glutamyl-tRNA(Gln) amidotransferase subunit B